ncbi:MAG TPA: hypothetical protein VLE53_01670 [Gemmatimonadaceae bacterium]|nr:hypothetical protein [Gemmatimonadaceae bacterium]
MHRRNRSGDGRTQTPDELQADPAASKLGIDDELRQRGIPMAIGEHAPQADEPPALPRRHVGRAPERALQCRLVVDGNARPPEQLLIRRRIR